MAAGKLKEAQAAVASAISARPNDGGLWNLAGIIAAQQGDLPSAESAFSKAVRFSPSLAAAWLNLGRVYVLDPDHAQATKGIAAYEKVLKLDPTNAEAHHQLALLLQWKGSFRESLGHLDKLPPEDQQRRSAVALRCADEAALGNTDTALRLAKALLDEPSLEPGDITSILPVVASHNDAVAAALLEGLAARRMASPEALAQLAALYEKRGDLPAARKAYEAAFQASPKSAKLLTDLARIAWKQSDYEGVLGYLAHARDLDPNNPGIHFVFGLACNELKLPIDARKSMEKALELAPENPYYNYAMGVLRTQWQDKDGALPYLQKYVSMKPEDPRGHLALGSLYFSLYKLDEAKRELTLAVKAPDMAAGAELLLGRIAAQEDESDRAIQHFRRVIELEPKISEAHAELGSVYLQQDNMEAAQKETELALAIDPKDYTANRNLIRIYRQSDDPRLKDQVERVKTLVEERDAQSRQLQRTIEVRPY